MSLLVGVVGHPVAHSLSPAMHNAAFALEGRDASYEAFDVLPQDFEAFVAKMRAAGAVGLNVTVPHKGAAFELSAVRSPDAEHTRAVNTLVFADDRVEGHNTDVAGIARALEELGTDATAGRVLVLGAGGAGRAAAWAAVGLLGAAEVLVANRTASRAAELCTLLGGRASVVDWARTASAAADADIVIQATTVGLDGAASPFTAKDLAAAAAGRCRYLLDLVYGPRETPLVRLARSVGITASDGLSVLVHQGAEAYRLWWDGPSDQAGRADVMRRAAARAIGRE